MNTLRKLQLLGASAEYDRCGCECGAREAWRRKRVGIPADGIYPATRPGGGSTLLLKVLQSNHCLNDCAYCANRCERAVRRASFEPRELTALFFTYLKKNYVEGLFLSSGIRRSGEESMGALLETVSLVRQQGFRGYIHTKILPGATRDQIKYAASLSTRLSINIEVPSKSRLAELSNQKDYCGDILRRMKWICDEQGKGRLHGGQTTQFIVGAADESDREIVKMTAWLYDEMHLRRTYFSAFSPIRETPLEGHHQTPSLREHRLYQADFLLRDYGFKFKELVFGEDGNMPRTVDPKMAWALEHPELFPLDARDACLEELIRVPGIGRATADRIITARDGRTISPLLPKKSRPFLELGGTRQTRLP